MIRFHRDMGDGRDHGCERNHRKEICCAVERRRTRPVGETNPERERPRPAPAEGEYFVEGRRLGCQRRMERQRDRRGLGDQRIDGLPGAQTTCGRRPRGCVEPQATSGACRSENFRRREGSQADCPGLFRTSQGPRTLDIAVVGEQGRRTEYRRSRQRQHDRADPQKNILKPHLKQQWVIPPKANSAFVAAMEDVLAVYTRPRDPDMPLVCLDETSKQLIAETRAPIKMKEGRPARFDYEYERNGTANLFMMLAPLEGWRHVKVTDRHTALDYAHALKDLADIHFLNAKKIALVQDNLNTHTKASLYDAFPAAEARRLAERFEWHYTPKHGSWLDMAESELGVLSSQCLDRRIPDKQTLIDEIAAWEDDRNANHANADWQFTAADARIKLKHLYPSI